MIDANGMDLSVKPGRSVFMCKYMLKRLGSSLMVLFLVSVIIFVLIHLQPGNPFVSMISPDTDPAFVAERMEAMGYNDSLPLQYVKWLGRVFQGDLGYSIQYKVPVMKMIAYRLGNTILLSGTAFVVSTLIALCLGIFSAAQKNCWPDALITVLSFVGISLPTFFMALLFVKIFSYDFALLPPTGMMTPGAKSVGFAHFVDVARHMIMPVLVLVTTHAAILLRYVRSSMVEILRQNYIRTARVKGLGRFRTVVVHGFRNTFVPVITILCIQFPNLLSGAVVTETVFVWPGIGRLNYDAILARDYPLIMAITMVLATFMVVMNLMGDILCSIADPESRLKI